MGWSGLSINPSVHVSPLTLQTNKNKIWYSIVSLDTTSKYPKISSNVTADEDICELGLTLGK
jgi:hypothetical protein